MSADKLIAEAAKAGARKAIEWLAEEGLELAEDAIDAAREALVAALAGRVKVVHAKRLEVVDERTLDAPEPGGW